jgi:hypothetical protein
MLKHMADEQIQRVHRGSAVDLEAMSFEKRREGESYALFVIYKQDVCSIGHDC